MDGPSGARDLLVRGVAAAKDGSHQEARFYLEWMLRLDCSREQRLRALYYMSIAAETPVKQFQYLEELLAEEPNHPEARLRLAELRGRLPPGERIQPDRLAKAAPARVEKRKAECDSCGGRLVFTPDGSQLECERCGGRVAPAAPEPEAPGESDFVLTLAQSAGHQIPMAERAFDCPSCGAVFSLAEASLSHDCPFCASHFVPHEAQQQWIPPDGVLPFRVARDAALQAMDAWCAQAGLGRGADPTTLRGLFLPVWDFDVAGRMLMCRDDGGGPFAEWPVSHPHVLIPASPSWPGRLREMAGRFDLSAAIAYEPGALAGWTAELYRLPPADASLRAREIVVSQETARIPDNAPGFPSSAEVSVLTVHLLLLPVWSGMAAEAPPRRLIFVHGQSGETDGETLS